MVWYSDKAFKKDKTDIQVMEDMVKITPDHKELLKHPVCMALLRRKWRQLECQYFGWLFAKFVFLNMFTD